MLQARSAREGRLEERDGEGKIISLPEKLRNKFTGPFKMLRWRDERHCVIEIEGKQHAHNVNRLIKHHVWDDIHMRTDTHAQSENAESSPKVGELVVSHNIQRPT